MVETSSEEDAEDKTLPLAALGRDSISQIKVASNEMERLQLLAEKAGATSATGPTTINNNLKSNHVKNNNINSNMNSGSPNKFNAPKPLQVIDTNANLPKPEINPTIDNKVQIGKFGSLFPQLNDIVFIYTL